MEPKPRQHGGLQVRQQVSRSKKTQNTRSHIYIKVFTVYTVYVFRVSFLLRPYCLIFREFMPSLDEFFAEAIEQADPANMVEDEYK